LPEPIAAGYAVGRLLAGTALAYWRSVCRAV